MENLNSVMAAANNGDAVAQYKLGRAFETGDGVTQNINVAKDWYKRSADNGYKNAEVKLRLLSADTEEEPKETAEPVKNQTIVKQPYKAPPAPPLFPNGNNAPLTNNVNTNRTANKTSSAPKSKVSAAVLAFFLGCYGVHDFYLGHNRNGIIKIVLTLTLLFSFVSFVWAFVDFILILCNSKLDSDGQPLK